MCWHIQQVLFDYPQRELAVITFTNLVIKYINSIADSPSGIHTMLKIMDFKVTNLILKSLWMKQLVQKYHWQFTICVTCDINMIFLCFHEIPFWIVLRWLWTKFQSDFITFNTCVESLFGIFLAANDARIAPFCCA